MRLRLPAGLARRLGLAELRKSLHTKEADTAKARCRLAVAWFQELTGQLERMSNPTRGQLEVAARQYFARLQEEIDTRPPMEAEQFEALLPSNLERTRKAREERDDALRANNFGEATESKARELVRWVGGTFEELDRPAQLFALQLIARAERQQLRYLEHVLIAPHGRFDPDDEAFAGRPEPAALSGAVAQSQSTITLADAGMRYLQRKQLTGVGKSHVDELGRALGWLNEEFGPDRPLSRLSADDLRTIRDGIERRDVRLRGRATSFRQSQTDSREHQISAATAKRYWSSIQGFLDWAVEEQFLGTSPASTFRIAPKRGERRRSPEPFNELELRKLFRTPLYAGRRPRQPTVDGPSLVRDGRWWSGVIPLFTGLRAGELAQLLPGDFAFDAPVPHVKVREEDDSGVRVKTAKTASSIRETPLTPLLLELGLREFVERQRSRAPSGRVFSEFRPGVGRSSDGLTKFWGAYLRKFGLWKPGRATHVMRHTFVARLRELEVPEPDIAALVGHAPRSQTAQYGGGYTLTRKSKIIERLDYGFDLVTVLGGPYDAKKHR